MVQKAISYISREVGSMHQAAYLLAFFTFAAQILGFIRDRMLAGTFGAGPMLDIYYTAFRIPDLIFAVLSVFTVGVVLIPLFVKARSESHDKYKKFIDANFTALCIVAIVLVVIGWFVMPHILSVFFKPQYESIYGETLLAMSRLILVSPFLMTLSGLFGSITQSEKRFFVYAMSPILYNLGIIAGLIFLYPIYGLVGLAYGVVLGAALHALIQVPTLIQLKTFPGVFTKFWQNKNLRESTLIAIPRSVGQFFFQLSTVTAVAVAGRIAAGAVSVFSISQIIYMVPLTLIGGSYNTASFPILSELYSKGKNEEFLARLSQASRHIIFWMIPISVLFIVLRAQIVRTIYGSGNFGWEETRLVAATVAILIMPLAINGLVNLFAQTMYVVNRAKLAIGLVILNSVMTMALLPTSVWFLKTFPVAQMFFEALFRVDNLDGSRVVAIPLAIIIAQIITFIIYYHIIKNMFGAFMSQLMQVFIHVFGAACIMGYSTYLALQFLDKFLDNSTGMGIFLQGLFAGIFGIAIHILILKLLRNKELEVVIDTIHSRIWKTKPIVDQTATQPEL